MPDTIDHAPICLDNAEKIGAVRFGRVVASITLVYDEGDTATFPLPEPLELVDQWKLTPTQAAILRICRDSKVPLTRKAIAQRLGRKSVKTGKDVSGKLAADFRRLLSLKAIFSEDGLYTDDRKKFAA